MPSDPLHYCFFALICMIHSMLHHMYIYCAVVDYICQCNEPGENSDHPGGCHGTAGSYVYVQR